MDFAQAEAIAKLVAAFGAPIWAGVILWLFYQIWRILSGGFKVLEKRDQDLQQMIEANASAANVRMALMEQLLGRHDENIDDIWDRIERRATPRGGRTNHD